jgi:signal transduction histidine kinase
MLSSSGSRIPDHISNGWRVLWHSSRPGGLRRRILVWFLVLSLLPLFLSNTLGYQVTRRIIERQAQRYLAALAEAEAGHVATEVQRHQQRLDAEVRGNTALAGMLVLVGDRERAGLADPTEVERLRVHLGRKLEELPAFTELLALNADGVVVAATTARRRESDWSATAVYQLGRHGRYFTEDVESHGGLLTPVYRLATPIRASGGAVVGVLVATVGFDRVQGFFRMADHVVGDVHSYLVDGAGNLLQASHVHPAIEHGRPLPSPLVQSGSTPTQRYVNYEGIKVLAAVAPLGAGTRAWWYVAEAPEGSILGQLRGLGLLAGVLEAGFALLLVAIVWLVARSIVTPLRRLVAGAERIRAGELGVEVRVDRADELGDLGRTFNQMSQELRTSTRRIQELHDQEMRRAAQLASVGELASGIAHEIKNPLIGVSSGLDLLRRRAGVDSQAETLIGQMRDQLGRIEVAIRDLLSYARPKELRVIRTDLNRLADRVVRLVTPQADQAGVRIETRLSAAVTKIQVDPELMTQTLVNLALNGIQAMEPGGVLTLSTFLHGHEVRLEIADTGSGIPVDRLDRIFRPFFTTKHRGTGLGLAISRGIVERHGGWLDVRSEAGQGSVFTIAFAKPEQEAVSP